MADLASFAAVRDLIEERCGLRFDDTQRASLSSSVSARMQQLALSGEEEYLSRLRGAAPTLVEAELRNLLNLVTVTETCFFRDGSQFHLLREYIIPSLMAERIARGQPKRIRIWSAGCSSGEEAYSIAITLDEMGLFLDPDWSIEIIGTDLNTKVLEKARRGVYSTRAVRNVEGMLLHDHFTRNEKLFALSDAIKKRVKFEFGNLTQTPMPSTGPQDIVFCKNVTIYFRPEVTRRLIAGLHDTIAPDGFLLLGHAESLWQVSDRFTLVEHERAFCYRKTQHIAPPPTSAVAQGFTPAPSEALTQYDVCLAAFRAGDWDIAESTLTSLVAECPTFVPGLLLLGGLYVHRGRFDDAMEQAEAALKVSDLEPRAHLLCGMIAARRRASEEAVQSLRRALYLDDSLALGHFWLGNLYRERGDVARACLEYENVVRDAARHTLELTEEFASDLTADQLVAFCSDMLERLRGPLAGSR
ncbi:MAG TPA: CheR family methyltransferase [Vicinamibacterales bacterium]|nr:CheR family methyltransferase [Vicinamibacterales bacterium]